MPKFKTMKTIIAFSKGIAESLSDISMVVGDDGGLRMRVSGTKKVSLIGFGRSKAPVVPSLWIDSGELNIPRVPGEHLVGRRSLRAYAEPANWRLLSVRCVRELGDRLPGNGISP